MTWVWISVAAAVAQAIRFMLQKQLRVATLTTGGATFARFLYSAPLAAALAWGWCAGTGQGPSLANARFWAFALSGGLAQIGGTLCVVALFARRNFAVGVTLSKTEVLLSAVVAIVVLGDRISAGAWGALALGLPGVLLLSNAPAVIGPRRLLNATAGLGLGAGLAFALSAVAYRGASLSLDTGDTLARAAVTLACVTTAQIAMMAPWLALREPGQIGAVLAAWRRAGLVGVFGMLGSLGWFAAFTLQTVALVKGVGQVELAVSIVIGALVFGERITRAELAGIACLAASILGVILLA